MKSPQPTSPYWSVILRSPMTSWLSITHRATGAALVYGIFMLVWWVSAAAIGEHAYGIFSSFCGSIWGFLTLFPLTGIFIYHALNGVRHLIWDAGGLLKLSHAKIAGFVVLFLSVASTLSIWAYLLLTYYVS